MSKPTTIQTEIRVSDVLAFYGNRATSYFLCFNIAKMLADKLEQHPKWEKHVTDNEMCFSEKNVTGFKQSGFYYYDFMDIFMNRSRFEELILEQLQNAINKYTTPPNGDWKILSHSEINFLADLAHMERREYREFILSNWLESDPEAVFVIEV